MHIKVFGFQKCHHLQMKKRLVKSALLWAPALVYGLGLFLVQAQAANDVYVKHRFNDWEVHCARSEDSRERCQAYYLVQDQDGNSIAEWSAFNVTSDGSRAGSSIVVPLETLLTEMLRIQVDDGPIRSHPFSLCSSYGCFAQIDFSQAQVAELRQGQSAFLTIVPAVAPNDPFRLRVSLSGFREALAGASGSDE